MRISAGVRFDIVVTDRPDHDWAACIRVWYPKCLCCLVTRPHRQSRLGNAMLRLILDKLLPYCNAFPAQRSVIVLYNASIHVNPRIEEVIKAHGCEVRYLPPYSPDFNPIEVSFSVSKAWVRRHQDTLWPTFPGTFGGYLRYAVRRSRCDRFAHIHFRHSAYGRYIFEEDTRAKQATCKIRNRGGG